MAYSAIEVEGKRVLGGELQLQGSKNAALPMLAAALLNKGSTILDNCPDISDVNDMIELLKSLGCKIVREKKKVIIDASDITGYEIEHETAKRTRGSFLILGALLGRKKKARVPYPGGCRIGKRPVDIHIKALTKLGMEFLSENECEVFALFNKKKDITFRFSYPSVGATQNAILAAVIGKGTVAVLKNCAREPEVSALCSMLNDMGADIEGVGTSELRIKGVDKLHDAECVVPGDRIVAGTYMTAAMISKGSVTLRGIKTQQLLKEIEIFKNAGAAITIWEDTLHIRFSEKNSRILPVKMIKTKPYPGFSTDMQSQIMSMLIYADGKSRIVENIFENRFMTVDELIKMGADIKVNKNTAIITGCVRLYGADMQALDLRGGVSLVLAALGALGKSRITGYEHILRGYEDLTGNLSLLGADVKIIT